MIAAYLLVDFDKKTPKGQDIQKTGSTLGILFRLGDLRWSAGYASNLARYGCQRSLVAAQSRSEARPVSKNVVTIAQEQSTDM